MRRHLALRILSLATVLALSTPALSAPVRADHAVVVLSFHFDASINRTAAAFGPLSEAAWAPDFKPRFVFPRKPTQVAGTVFTTSTDRVWLLHDFDTEAGFVQYVIVDANSEITLTIRVARSATGSLATMTYDIVALNEAGAKHLTTIQTHVRALTEHMQGAISGYLARSEP
jgi:hypothetical protein